MTWMNALEIVRKMVLSLVCLRKRCWQICLCFICENRIRSVWKQQSSWGPCIQVLLNGSPQCSQFWRKTTPDLCIGVSENLLTVHQNYGQIQPSIKQLNWTLDSHSFANASQISWSITRCRAAKYLKYYEHMDLYYAIWKSQWRWYVKVNPAQKYWPGEWVL